MNGPGKPASINSIQDAEDFLRAVPESKRVNMETYRRALDVLFEAVRAQESKKLVEFI